MHNWIGNDSSCEDQRSTTDFFRDPRDTREKRPGMGVKELEQERERARIEILVAPEVERYCFRTR